MLNKQKLVRTKSQLVRTKKQLVRTKKQLVRTKKRFLLLKWGVIGGFFVDFVGFLLFCKDF
ncbi:MAG: hypothetical protein LBE12_07825 [Planctomycetaceae bacterium]|jgi:hypothetical protein|nr:hypothetical protein [Planctomycetaceae bacterium]